MADIEKIKKQFKKVITYSQGIEDPQIDKLFDRWYKAKSYFIEQLNGELIYEYPEEITFEMNPEDKNRKIGDFITELNWRYGNHDLELFIEAQRDGFYSNTVIENYMYNEVMIPKGMKLVKAFKYFIHDKEILTEIQMSASRVIQEDKVKGILCVSVHPLDFLSSSENTHNWRSCHSLDGEYRAGNLSYMVDESTVICYLRSDYRDVLPNFPDTVPWNDKKWRTLLHIADNKNFIFAGRSYPFSSKAGMDAIRKYLLPKIINRSCEWKPWDNKRVSTFTTTEGASFQLQESYYPIGGKLKPISEIVKIPGYSLNFNDVLHSSYYVPLYTTYDGLQYLPHNTSMTVGGGVNCLRDEEHLIQLPEIMTCIDCEEIYGNCDSESFVYCHECGSHVYENNAIYLSNGMILCEGCAFDDGLAVQCADCGEWLYAYDAIPVKDENDNIVEYLCSYCTEYRHKNEED